jgi:hypothetical protein
MKRQTPSSTSVSGTNVSLIVRGATEVEYRPTGKDIPRA